MHHTLNDNSTECDYKAEAERLSDLLMKSEAESSHWKLIASRHEDELKRCHVIIQTIEAMIGRELPL